ncbi:MAG TPA: phosphomevalonate kinase, partial [Bacillota bacterium]|nr:phosphomevalonate kinase [Bacillota bacterium]
MLGTPITIKVPGKLMIAGEYAVLEKHHTLVAMAVDRFVYATIHLFDEQKLELENLDLHNISWKFQTGDVAFDDEDK